MGPIDSMESEFVQNQEYHLPSPVAHSGRIGIFEAL